MLKSIVTFSKKKNIKVQQHIQTILVLLFVILLVLDPTTLSRFREFGSDKSLRGIVVFKCSSNKLEPQQKWQWVNALLNIQTYEKFQFEKLKRQHQQI